MVKAAFGNRRQSAQVFTLLRGHSKSISGSGESRVFLRTSCDGNLSIRSGRGPCRCLRIARAPRCAMTLVELLVVIAIIGTLIGLVIPAIRTARTSARGTACQNNLRQIGLALEMHHRDLKSYPADARNGYGICAFLLPYVEEQALYSRLQPAERQRPANIARPDLGGAPIEVFCCPAIGNGGKTMLELGRGTYIGTTDLFPWRAARADIRDGKSNTIALGETLADQAWVLPGTADAVPPGERSMFGSRHAGGANFVFCDTSVHLIGEDIDPVVFAALCTTDGGEPVTEW